MAQMEMIVAFFEVYDNYKSLIFRCTGIFYLEVICFFAIVTLTHKIQEFAPYYCYFSCSDNSEHDLLLSINQELMKYDFPYGGTLPAAGTAVFHSVSKIYCACSTTSLTLLYIT